MGLITTVLIIVAVALLPLVLFFSLVGLALFVWSWRRIGPYFVSFGRWVADWRNIIPLGCLGTVGIVAVVLFAAILPPGLSFLRYLLLGLLIAGGVVFTIVALFVWTIRLIAWVWPRFRRGFWGYLEKGYSFALQGGTGGQRRGKARRGGQKAPPPKAAPGEPSPSEPGGAPAAGARPMARRAPARKRALLDLSWLWALLSGKPRKPDKKVKLTDRPAEAPLQVAAKPKARKMVKVPTRPKAGLRPIIWRLGLIIPWLQGKLQRSGQKRGLKPVTLHKAPGVADRPGTPAGGVSGQPGQGAPAPPAKTGEAKPKAVLTAGKKRRRSLAESLQGTAGSMLNAVQSVRKRFWLGIFWVLGRARGGLDYIARVPRRFRK